MVDEPTYRTASGRVLTDTDLARLADEAEAGYPIRGMRIDELDESVVGRRIRVVGMVIAESERQGHVDDSTRMLLKEGVAINLVTSLGGQLRVDWIDGDCTLSLVGADRIEILPEPYAERQLDGTIAIRDLDLSDQELICAGLLALSEHPSLCSTAAARHADYVLERVRNASS